MYLSEPQPSCYDLSTTYTIHEVAEKLGVDERTIRAWIARGELKGVNLSRNVNSRKPRIRIMETALEQFLELRSTRPVVRMPRRPKLPPVPRYV